MTRLLSRPYPLGATVNKEGCNFSIHAPGNKDIKLALFAGDGSYALHDLPNEYAGIRHTFIPDIKPGVASALVSLHPCAPVEHSSGIDGDATP